MRRNALQPSLDLFAPVPRSLNGARSAALYSPWPVVRRESEVGRAVAEALAAMLHLGDDRKTAEGLPRILETAILASQSGPGGLELLEEVDRALVRVRGKDHGLLDGKYL